MSQERHSPAHKKDHDGPRQYDNYNPEQQNAEEFKDRDYPARMDDRQRRERSHSEPRSDSQRRQPQRNYSRSASREKRDGRENTQIYVAGINRSVREEDLREPFEKFGPIRSVIMKGKYAFIDYRESKDALEAVQKMNGTTLADAPIVVEVTRPKGDGPRRSGPKKDDECWKCRGFGHWANECRARPMRRDDRDRRDYRRRSDSRDRYNRSSPPYRQRRGSRSDDSRDAERREGRCFLCKAKGHIKAHCPEKGGSRDPRESRYMDRREERPPYDDRERGPRYYSRSRSPVRDRRPPPRTYDREPPRRDFGGPRDRSPPRSPPSDGRPAYNNRYM